MANILLDKVQPNSDEIKDGLVDYGKILQRLFDNGQYIQTNSPGMPPIVGTSTSLDSIYISPNSALIFYTSVVQKNESPDFKGTLNLNIINNTFSKSQIIFHGTSATSRITFVKPTSINGVSFSNYERFLNHSLIELVGNYTSSISDCFFNNYSKNNFAVICRQTSINCLSCSFTGQGTSLLAESTCSNVNFRNNLNHGVGRAIKVINSSTIGCKVSLIENTLDIGGQLLWVSGRILSNSIIQYNTVEYHSKGLTNEPNNGQVIYISGQIDGIRILDNIFSGADKINGDVTNTTQFDSFPRRPLSCITLDGVFLKNNVIIKRNQFRYSNQAIIVNTPASNLRITSNLFVGEFNSRTACSILGVSGITNSFFNLNLLNSVNAMTLRTSVNLFNFNSNILNNVEVLGNIVCNNGECFINISPTSSNIKISRNLNDSLDVTDS